jgi:Flp pilus assembly pilin Flp
VRSGVAVALAPERRTDVFQTLKANFALFKDRRGVTAVEYAVIAGCIVLGIATAFTALGTKISTFFTGLAL